MAKISLLALLPLKAITSPSCHVFILLLKRQITIQLPSNAPHDSPYSGWASPPINLVISLILDWPFYNSKSFKPNRLASLFGQKIRKTLSYFQSSCQSSLLCLLAQSLACRIFLLNWFFSGKDELASVAATEGNNTAAISRIPIPALGVAPTTTLSSVTLYSKDND